MPIELRSWSGAGHLNFSIFRRQALLSTGADSSSMSSLHRRFVRLCRDIRHSCAAVSATTARSSVRCRGCGNAFLVSSGQYGVEDTVPSSGIAGFQRPEHIAISDRQGDWLWRGKSAATTRTCASKMRYARPRKSHATNWRRLQLVKISYKFISMAEATHVTFRLSFV